MTNKERHKIGMAVRRLRQNAHLTPIHRNNPHRQSMREMINDPRRDHPHTRENARRVRQVEESGAPGEGTGPE